MTKYFEERSQIQQATDIVDLIGEHIALKRKGREFVGLCPFHDDHNPSMAVVPHKQIFHCFVCGTGGDAFTFVMKYHRMTFPETIRFLADRAGITLEPRPAKDEEQAKMSKGLRDAHRFAQDYFRSQWQDPQHGRVARHYVEERGIGVDMIRDFELGYAPDRWDGLASTIQEKGWSFAPFVEAGLVVKRDKERGHYDRFRNRLIFPICDSIGRPIAFGGRRLREEDEPKYLNSPQTALFDKSSTVYGLNLARTKMIAERTVVVVEGYTDVIACHQAGIKNVVATLGTALTERHVRQLRHYADRVVLIFDPDEAGQQAAERAVEVFLSGRLDVSIAVLPETLDPADLLARPDGPHRWRQVITQSTDAMTFLFQRLGGHLAESQTMSGRQRVATEFLQRLSGLGLERQEPIRRSMIMQHLARLLRLSEQQILAVIRERSGRPTPSGTAGPAGRSENHENPQINSENGVALSDPAPRMAALQLAERQLIGALLRNPTLFRCQLMDGKALDEVITPGDMVSDAAQRLYMQVYGLLHDQGQISLSDLLADPEIQENEELVNLAVGAEADMEHFCQDDEELLATALCGAAQTIRHHHMQEQYDRMRSACVGGMESNGFEEQGQDEMLRKVVETRRTTIRPSSIGRVRTL